MKIKKTDRNTNCSKFLGQLVNIEAKENRLVEIVDFQIKVKRKLNQEVYDYIDCSIYHEEAVRFLRFAKVGDMIRVTGEFRSSKQEIDKEIVTGKFSHFLAREICRF